MKELSPALRSLLSGTAPELGPGPRAGVEAMTALNRRVDEAVHALGLDTRRSELVRALVLLWHDHHEPAHHIVQELEDQDGSYIHAILHRREPDYSNAKYWFRRVGVHPCFAELAAPAAPILRQAPHPRVAALAAAERWNPNAFVDACEAAREDAPSAELLRQVQAIEFALLLSVLSH
jgi:hypothetical protein